MTESIYQVTGMTCDHCVKTAQKELGDLPGVTDVRVRLVPEGVSEISVASTAPLDLAVVAAVLDEAGFDLVT
ncbi:MAG: heavy-metal-associated domain-containing protein [Bifidobacteriaceae bacterium]|jgi:copper chaperone CopZ|nr:heavy-metal-associated domain-containing protein [Bifidobacteriaceae bacterium]